MSGLHEDPSVHTLPEHSEDVTTMLGAARDPHQPHPRAEAHGPAVLEVAQLWQDTVLEVRHLAPPSRSDGRSALTVGAATGPRRRILGLPLGPAVVVADLFVPGEALPSDLHELVAWQDGGFVAAVDARWSGWLERDGQRIPLADVLSGCPQAEPGVHAVRIEAGAQLLLEIGAVRILARLAAPGARVAGRRSSEVDLPFVGIMSSMVAVAALLSVAIATAPPPTVDSVVEVPDRFTDVFLSVQPPPPPAVATERASDPDAGAGKRAIKEEGRSGRERGKRQAKGARVDRQQLDRQIAEDAGVLGALADAGALGGVFDGGMNAELTAGIGGLYGAVGVQMGTGYGDRGQGPGGGGNEVGSFHGTGTHGRSDGSSGDYAGSGDMGPKRDGGVRTQGEPVIMGGLDKSLIDAVIKRNMNQIRYCYQRELTRDPELAGKVTVQFVIARDGSVSKAKVKSSSLGSAAVESCMTDRFLRFQFPQPSGGGIVIVSYPFMFSRG